MTATYMEFRSLKLLCKTCLIMIAGNVSNATIFNFLFFSFIQFAFTPHFARFFPIFPPPIEYRTCREFTRENSFNVNRDISRPFYTRGLFDIYV